MVVERPAHQFVAFALGVGAFALQIHVECLVDVPIHIDIAVHPLAVNHYLGCDDVPGLHLKDGRRLVEVGRTLYGRCNARQFLSFTLCTHDAHALGVVRAVIDVHVRSVRHVVVALSLQPRPETECHQGKK